MDAASITPMRPREDPFTTEDLNVRLYVTLGFSLTVGLYDGPITKAVIGEHLREQLSLAPVEDRIVRVSIDAVEDDDGRQIVYPGKD